MLIPSIKVLLSRWSFGGLKAQYIWYLGGGLIALLILFAILYICGVNTFVCLGIIIISGTALFMYVYKLSRKYGEHGMMKVLTKKRVPGVIKSYSRKTFGLPKLSEKSGQVSSGGEGSNQKAQ